MHKFFDYLAPDLPVKTIGELAGYIRRFAALFSGGVPVEGHMGGVAFLSLIHICFCFSVVGLVSRSNDPEYES